MISRVMQGKNTSMTQPFHYAGQKGYNYYHGGVDLTGFNGVYNTCDWIVAHSEGTVVDIRTNCVGYQQGSYGNYVLLKHPNGYYTMYAHLAYGYMRVQLGQTVKKGAVLGYMGNTGHSFGAHLHWQVRNFNGVCIDPQPYLNAELPNMGKKVKPVKVDGVWKQSLTRRLEIIFGLPKTGVIKSQYSKFKKLCPACDTVLAWKFVKKPKSSSRLIKKIQRWLKVVKVTGHINEPTIVALQKKFKVPVTGKIDTRTVKKIQKWVNKKLS